MNEDLIHVAQTPSMRRIILISLGWINLGIGLVGVVLPLLPTTPFVLLAALCFSKGSPQLHTWLSNSRLFGQIIKDWETRGAIRIRSKILSTVMMCGLVSYPIFFKSMALWIKLSAGISVFCVMIFIWSRPSR